MTPYIWPGSPTVRGHYEDTHWFNAEGSLCGALPYTTTNPRLRPSASGVATCPLCERLRDRPAPEINTRFPDID